MTRHRLVRGQTLVCACILVLVSALAGFSPALAQFLPTPGQASPPAQFPGGNDPAFPPPPGQRGPGGGGPPPAGLTGPQAVCATFPPIRQAAEQGALAIRHAGERKAPREEVCSLFKSFVVKEARLIKFLSDHRTVCGVPQEAITSAKTNHVKTIAIAKNVCGGGAPPGPSLSDALGGPIIADDSATKQPGRGTFDTLTGNVLSR